MSISATITALGRRVPFIAVTSFANAPIVVETAMLAGTDVPMLGALSHETYRRWLTRTLERA